MTNEAGLQFEGEPSDDALMAELVWWRVQSFLDGGKPLSDCDWKYVLKALELMAQEKTND